MNGVLVIDHRSPGSIASSTAPLAHRRQRDLGRVVQRPDRRGPRLQPGPLRPRDPSGHEHRRHAPRTTAAGRTGGPGRHRGLTSAGLSWAASTDNVGVIRYNVHRSTTSGFTPSAGNRVAQPTGTSYTDVGLAPGTYYYGHRRGRRRATSRRLERGDRDVIGDTVAPSAPGTLNATGGVRTRDALSWSAATDNVGVSPLQRPPLDDRRLHAAAEPDRTADGDELHRHRVARHVLLQRHRGGRRRQRRRPLERGERDGDGRHDLAPTGVTATGSSSSVGLAWTASTDNVGVTRYNVHRSTTTGFTPSAANRIAQPTGTSYTDSGLSPGTYYYRVIAEDAAGNLSAPSAQVAGNVSAALPPLASSGRTRSMRGRARPSVTVPATGTTARSGRRGRQRQVRRRAGVRRDQRLRHHHLTRRARPDERQ